MISNVKSFFVGCFLLGNLVMHAQSDHPCGAPLMTLSSCTGPTPLRLAGSGFDAADAPIPPGCNAAYTRDVWVRVVAPYNNPTLSFITRRNLAFGSAQNPSQIVALWYSATPDCANLVNEAGCPSLCPLGLICLSLDNDESHALAREFNGIVGGQTYYVRFLWNPTFDPAPDTIRISLPPTRCMPCDGCAGSDVVLDAHALPFRAWREEDMVVLSWETGSDAHVGEFSVMRSSDGVNWAEIDIQHREADGGHRGQDLQPMNGTGYYRLRHTGQDGAISWSEVVQVMGSGGDWLTSLAWDADALVLNIGKKSPQSVQVLDAQGRLIRREVPLDGMIRVPRSSLPSGVLLIVPEGMAGALPHRVLNLRH